MSERSVRGGAARVAYTAKTLEKQIILTGPLVRAHCRQHIHELADCTVSLGRDSIIHS